MSLIEVVSRYGGTPDSGRPVVVLPAAEALAGALATPDAANGSGGRSSGRVLVDLAVVGEEVATVERIAPTMEERDVLVLVLRSTPESLPSGPLVQALCAHGLRVLQSERLPTRHAPTVLVLTGDASLPQRSYLLGEALPESDAMHLRQANEWAVEGLQLRALVARHETALAEAKGDISSLKAERDALQSRADSLAARNAQLGAAADRRMSRKVRRAARLLRDDPVGGSRRLARAAARRLGH